MFKYEDVEHEAQLGNSTNLKSNFIMSAMFSLYCNFPSVTLESITFPSYFLTLVDPYGQK